MINIVYFAKYREALGLAEEAYDLGTGAVALSVLKTAILQRHAKAVSVLEDARCIVAINQQVAGPDASVSPGDEVAFFPPVTGG